MSILASILCCVCPNAVVAGLSDEGVQLYPFKDVLYVIDDMSGDGVGAVSYDSSGEGNSHQVAYIVSKDEIRVTRRHPSGELQLAVSEKGIRMTSFSPFYYSQDGKEKSDVDFSFFLQKSVQQESLVLIEDQSVTVMDGLKVFSMNNWNGSCGIAISPDEKRILTLHHEFNTGLMNVYEYKDSQWVKTVGGLWPRLERGEASMVGGHNDIRFIREDVVVFIARIYHAVPTLQEPKPVFPGKYVLHSGPQMQSLYLLATDLKTGKTISVASLESEYYVHARGAGVGLLSVPKEGQHFYMVSDKGVLKIPNQPIFDRLAED